MMKHIHSSLFLLPLTYLQLLPYFPEIKVVGQAIHCVDFNSRLEIIGSALIVGETKDERNFRTAVGSSAKPYHRRTLNIPRALGAIRGEA
jgi:hypothetical protein